MNEHQDSVCGKLFFLPGNAEIVKVLEHSLTLIVLYHVSLNKSECQLSCREHMHTTSRAMRAWIS